MRSLGVTAEVGRDLNVFTMALLAAETEAVVARKVSGHTVYGIDRRSVMVSDVVDEESLDLDVNSDVVLTPNAVRCAMCGHLHVAPPELLDEWVGTPCLRYRCGGSFERAVPRQQDAIGNGGKTIKRALPAWQIGMGGRRCTVMEHQVAGDQRACCLVKQRKIAVGVAACCNQPQ